jgi:hypothetical protein
MVFRQTMKNWQKHLNNFHKPLAIINHFYL